MEAAYAGYALWDHAYEMESDPTRIESLRSTLDELDSLDVPLATTHLWLRLSHLEYETGEGAAQYRALERSISTDSRFGDHRITCQALGVLGNLRAEQGDIEGMHEAWDRGLVLAVRHHLPEQTGRLTTFLAGYYRSTGRLSLYKRLLREASDACQEFGGSPSEIRFLERLLEFNSALECWDIVETDLRRGQLLLDRYIEWYGEGVNSRVHAATHEGFHARASMAAGRVDEADHLFAAAESEYAEVGADQRAAEIRAHRARGLIEAERATEALVVLERGLDNPGSRQSEMLALAAGAHAMLAEWDRCEQKLDSFATARNEGPEVPLGTLTLYDTLRIQLARASGDTPAAIEAVQAACDSLATRLQSMDATPEGLLALRGARILYDELHDIVNPLPALAYRFELLWRRMPGLAGQPMPLSTQPSLGSPLTACSRVVISALRGARDSGDFELVAEGDLDSSGPMELVYCVGPDSLRRWSRVGNQLAHTVQPIPHRDFAAFVKRILLAFDRVPGENEKMTESLREDLHELAHLLLPPQLLGSGDHIRPDGTRPRELHVIAAGGLDGLPFAALNLSDSGYSPLIERFDPVYLKPGMSAAAVPAREQGAPLIVADPLPAPGFTGWRTGLHRLPYGIAEARALHGWKPESILLEREAATKRAVLAAWENAPFIYIASHVVQDPTAPYLSYIPLTPPEVETTTAVRREDGSLDAVDLRSVQFNAQPLVILSACSSGAPYRAYGTHSPGLGDAFLEAGASIVIQNCWSVQDEAAAALMQMAMPAWAVDGIDPATALNEARRRMAREGAFTHPYFWGSAVVLTGMP